MNVNNTPDLRVPEDECQCGREHDPPSAWCHAKITQEDLLCDTCRETRNDPDAVCTNFWYRPDDTRLNDTHLPYPNFDLWLKLGTSLDGNYEPEWAHRDV